MESAFPSNSQSSQPKKPAKPAVAEKKVEKVVTGEATLRKKSLGTRFKETFISGAETRSVFDYVFFDILVPAGKDLFIDATQAGLERKFYGEAQSAGRRGYGRGASRGYTAYNRIGTSPMVDQLLGRREEPRAVAPSRRARANHDFGEIVLQTRVEAVAVIDSLFELISKYEIATVADLYDLVGVASAFTDNRWGWSDLRGADVVRVREGYLLNLPAPEPID